jgi:ketosteroid isomerase-like protein
MREAIAAMNRGDVEGAVRGFDPEVQFEHRLASLQGSFVGVDAVRGWFTDLFNHFETSHIDCPDIRDLGDQVLALGTVYAAGTESGVQTELPFTVVASFRGGLCTHFVDYADKRQALEAVGLSE